MDEVKIDRSLTLTGPDNVSEHIVRSVIGLSRSLGIRTVVEGVEESEQLQRFLTLGCQAFQGYFFSRPLPEQRCLAFIRKFPYAAQPLSDNAVASVRFAAENPTTS